MSLESMTTPLHLLVFKGEIPPDEMDYSNINTFDIFGIPVLHYAIHTQNISIVKTLLLHGADPLLRNKNGFNAYQESVCTRNIELITLLYEETYNFYDAIYSKRVIDGIDTLEKMDDFQMTIHWELQTWIPLGTYLLPSDDNLARKRSHNLRFDMGIIGFENYNIKRGRGSLFFFGEDKGRWKKGEVFFVNHDEHTVEKMCGRGIRRKLKVKEVLLTDVTTMRTNFVLNCERAKNMWGNDRNESVNGIECRVFDVTPLSVNLVTREIPTNRPILPKIFSDSIYSQKEKWDTKNILLGNGEKEVYRKKTNGAELWVGKGAIQLSQFRILTGFLERNFDDYKKFEDFFDKNGLTDDDGFPVQLKIPLALSLSLVLNIKNYSKVQPEESVFDIPDDYTFVNNSTE
ncbi:hypothetical protein EIN_405180 [Entamoeba invadens IP1]|uniref:Ankyrin repeat domain-containing protein n=1 Tax=Entamoeba invadens IP1 TaxID=370355 RepID=A0A0A1UCT5_ENTIV|nr:hypothetical protein EIN_405180 [Entamoeba invadens IP1]ELP90104.1 hypothetical protein EIN_405180 [Entamoeba invadens IP1]|eukprot:XP_004256875.1 hypothetical protein EIN_405180 [Entamoeba invadens IP1]